MEDIRADSRVGEGTVAREGDKAREWDVVVKSPANAVEEGDVAVKRGLNVVGAGGGADEGGLAEAKVVTSDVGAVLKQVRVWSPSFHGNLFSAEDTLSTEETKRQQLRGRKMSAKHKSSNLPPSLTNVTTSVPTSETEKSNYFPDVPYRLWMPNLSCPLPSASSDGSFSGLSVDSAVRSPLFIFPNSSRPLSAFPISLQLLL